MSKGTVNKVILIGRLGNDPDVRTITSGAKVATISMATNESYKKGDEWQETTEWHRVVLWRNRADFAEKYLKKGTRVYVEGKLQTRQWQDNNGQQHYTTEIIANDIQLLDGAANYDNTAGAKVPPAQEDPFTAMPDSVNDSAPDDDIPF